MKAILGHFWMGTAVLGGAVLGGCASQQGGPAAPGSDAAQAERRMLAGTDQDPNGGAKLPGPAAAPTLSVNPAADATLAHIGGRSITLNQVLGPLLEAHGLNTLLNVAQLEVAKQWADEQRVVVTPDDVAKERRQTLAKMFQEYDEKIDEKIEAAEKEKQPREADRLRQEKQDAHDQLLQQFYTQQHITPGEFDMAMESAAYLRKLAGPMLKGKITEEMLETQYGVRYGEMVKVRHIQLKRPQDWPAVRGRLLGGEDFAKVAQEVSTNPMSAGRGGELTPFSQSDPRLPQNFKDVAFSLRKGQLSDLVEADNTFHVIKLEDRIAPKAVPFKAVRDIIFKDLEEQYTEAIIKGLREKMAEQIRGALKIEDPALKRQFEQRLAQGKAARAREKVQEDWEAERQRRGGEGSDASVPLGPATAPSAPFDPPRGRRDAAVGRPADRGAHPHDPRPAARGKGGRDARDRAGGEVIRTGSDRASEQPAGSLSVTLSVSVAYRTLPTIPLRR